MIKIFSGIVLTTLFSATLLSCGENKETKAETSTATTSTTVVTQPVSGAQPGAGIPVFSSEEVNRNLALFQSLKAEYIKALESRDPAKIADFAAKYKEWAASAAVWGSTLKPEEAQAFSDYMNRLNQEWSEATMSAVSN